MKEPIVCHKCLKVLMIADLIPASKIKGLSKEESAKFKACPACKCRTFI